MTSPAGAMLSSRGSWFRLETESGIRDLLRTSSLRRHRVDPEKSRGRAPAFLALLVILMGSTAGAAPRPMRFERLSIDQGLSQSVVNCILQDRVGFLWLGTQGGLNRYDGYRFEIYRHDAVDPASLASDYVLSLAEGPAGDLWVGTEGSGLARWRRASDSFTSYPHDPAGDGVSGRRVITLAWDRQDQLWAGTTDAGLSRLDPETGAVRRFRHDPDDASSLAHDQLGTIYVDRYGELWIGTWQGLDRFDRNRQSFVHFRHDPADPTTLSDDRVRAILEDSADRLWIGTHHGLNRLERRSGRFVRYLHDPDDPGSLSHDWVRTVFEDRDGRVWVGTDGGLNLWRQEIDRFDGYHPDPGRADSLRNDQVVDIEQDESGVLWIGTLAGGASKWNPRTWSFNHYLAEPAAGREVSNNVFAISEDPQGGLWTGTFGGGLERRDRATGTSVSFTYEQGNPDSLSDDRVTALLHDRGGTLWVGTVGGGLNRLLERPGGLAFARHRHDPARPESLSADAVAALFEDARGRLWVGTMGGGLDLLRDDGGFSHFRHDPADPASLGSDRVLALAEASNDGLWVATDGGGLNRLHPVTGAFLRLEHDPADAASLSGNELLAIHVDPTGRLWVGTKGRGLDRLESLDETTGRGSFVNYSLADGLPDGHVSGIRTGTEGALWLATNGGLSRLDPETDSFKNYDVSHGLQSNEFNLGAHFASSSGELFFGGVSGFNAFFPDRIEAAPHVPPVVLTSFTKINQPMRFERPLSEISEIALGYRDYAFSLEFAALDFVAPQRNRYRYKLEGFEDTWIDNGHRRWVSFTNLDPGRYLLRVQAAGSAGVWNQQGARVAIAVAPPPWRSRWAYALYALGLAAVAGIAVAVYSQHQETVRQRAVAGHQRERVRERENLIAERENLIGDRERLIEERERMAEKHEQLLAELADSNAQLGRKNAELERFNYTVTHDLKSPLVTIKGFLGMLRRDIGRDDRQRVEHDIGRVGAAADKMQTLLDELLDLARVSDPRRLARREVRLGEVVHEALELVAGLTLQRDLEIEVDPGLPVVMADPVRLLQVYQNLLANAMRYMGDQSSPRVEVGMRANDIFFVRDNGSGIDPRFQHKIFDLFERLETSEEGSGVGLAVVKRIIELHGGRVWVESQGEGRGSTFCFTLGDARLEDEEVAADALAI